MDTLSRRPKKRKSLKQQAVYDYQFNSEAAEELLEMFPLPRYFQVHFTHVHDNCEEAKQQINELGKAIEQIEKKLDRLLTELNVDNA